MNKKIADRWEVRLGIAQVIILLGVVTGCMTFAFYLGFFSGKQSGFDMAMETNASSSVKIPIGSTAHDGEAALHKTEQAVTEVYARLNDRAKDDGKSAENAAEQAVPELSSIKEAENPLADPWEAKPSGVNPQKEEKVLADDAADLFAEEEQKHEPVKEVAKQEAAVVPDAKKEDLKKEEAQKAELQKLELKKEEAKKEELKKEELKKEEARKLEAKKEDAKKEEAKKEELRKAEAKKVEEAKKVASADSAGIIRGTIPGGWYAQVAAPTKKADAEGVAARLKQSGFHVVIENAKVRGDDYYRILVGPEKNKSQAEALVGQVRRESFIKGMPFIRMVK